MCGKLTKFMGNVIADDRANYNRKAASFGDLRYIVGACGSTTMLLLRQRPKTM